MGFNFFVGKYLVWKKKLIILFRKFYWGGIVLNCVVIFKLKIELLIWFNLCLSYDFFFVGMIMVLIKNFLKVRVGIESF